MNKFSHKLMKSLDVRRRDWQGTHLKDFGKKQNKKPFTCPGRKVTCLGKNYNNLFFVRTNSLNQVKSPVYNCTQIKERSH